MPADIRCTGRCVMEKLNELGENAAILDRRQGDVNGDGMAETVLLIGVQPDGPQGLFCRDISLLIQLPCWDYCACVPLGSSTGYGPTLFLADFTGSGFEDIMVSIDSGGSGGYAYYYIFSYANCRLEKLFDFEMFNAASQYRVEYADDYRVNVISERTQQLWPLDISCRDAQYLSEIYSPAGELLSPLCGSVMPLGLLLPQYDRFSGCMSLQAMQSITGMYAADVLGYVYTTCRWEGRGFVAEDTAVAGISTCRAKVGSV